MPEPPTRQCSSPGSSHLPCPAAVHTLGKHTSPTRGSGDFSHHFKGREVMGGAGGGGKTERSFRRPRQALCYLLFPLTGVRFRSPPVTPPSTPTKKNKNKKHIAFRVLSKGQLPRSLLMLRPNGSLAPFLGHLAVFSEPNSSTYPRASQLSAPRLCCGFPTKEYFFHLFIPVCLAQSVFHKYLLPWVESQQSLQSSHFKGRPLTTSTYETLV